MNEMAKTPGPVRELLTFRVLGRLMGLDIAQVREVSTHMDFSTVPQAPPLVRGLANLRSKIYLVLDAGVAMGATPASCTTESRLIVLNQHVAENLGLLVERVGDIVRVSSEQMEDAPLAEESAALTLHASPVVALCKLEKELMMVIDPTRVVAALEVAIR